MALNAYLRMEGGAQGDVEGSVTQVGRENSIMVLAFSHEIDSPRDAASGLPMGRRQHGPIVICKEVDKASPVLFRMLANNEVITEWRLDFYRPSRSRTSRSRSAVQFYTIQLENARIGNIRTEMLNNSLPENRRQPEREYIQFYYHTITWTWQDGGIEAEDVWHTPVV